jgi:hypothetical protein
LTKANEGGAPRQRLRQVAAKTPVLLWRLGASSVLALALYKTVLYALVLRHGAPLAFVGRLAVRDPVLLLGAAVLPVLVLRRRQLIALRERLSLPDLRLRTLHLTAFVAIAVALQSRGAVPTGMAFIRCLHRGRLSTTQRLLGARAFESPRTRKATEIASGASVRSQACDEVS